MMSKLPVAVQVYSIRNDAEKDFAGTMKQVKAMGYDGVELAGLYGHSPEEIRNCLKEIGLHPVSAHVSYQELVSDMAGTIDKYTFIGCEYIAIPYLTEPYRPGAEKFYEVVENINKMGEICNNKGVVLLYHNHDFEFVRMEDGRSGLDYLYESVSVDKLKTEIDTCWVKVAGVSPEKYIEKYANRCPVVHLKDFTGCKSDHMYKLIGLENENKNEVGAFEFRPVGYGVQDIPAILTSALKSGASWVVVEQDEHNDKTALEDIKLSRDYLRKLGW